MQHVSSGTSWLIMLTVLSMTTAMLVFAGKP